MDERIPREEWPKCPHEDKENWSYGKDGQWKNISGLIPYEGGDKWEGNAEGKPKGIKNRRTLRQELIDKGGFSPAEYLNSIMNDERVSVTQRMAAAKELIGYTEAKLSSIEMHTDKDKKAPFSITLTDGITLTDKDKDPED